MMNYSSAPLHELPFHKTTLLWHDYLIFSIMLIISTSIGLYYGCSGTKQRTIREYILGNNKLTALPIAFSIAVGHFTAITLMAMPADVYKYGAYQIFGCISMLLLTIVSIYIYLPVFFNLRLTSAYEYLERRFDKKCKLLVSSLFIVCEFIYLAVVAYTPSLALSIATGYRTSVISAIICAICVFYTTIGGFKTVIWTDLFQFVVIIISLLLVCITGFILTGFFPPWIKAIEGGRFNIFDFDLDPTKRDSLWIFVFGYTAHYTNYVTLTQSGLQKFLALPSFRDCVRSMIYVGICLSTIYGCVVIMGVLLYDKYSDCDPLLSNRIGKHEQMVPYYIMDIAGHLPGVSGCFLAAIFCAALSTISSSLNALSSVIYKDFLYKYMINLREERATNILKVIVAICGACCICLVLVVEQLGDVVPLAASITSIGQGPSMGMFTLGILFPQANAKGAFYGALGGFIFTATMSLPKKFFYYKYKFTFPTKTLSIDGCQMTNKTIELVEIQNVYNNASFSKLDHYITPPFLFHISHYYYTLFGAIFTVILGLVVSYLTRKDNYEAEKILLSSVGQKLLRRRKSEEMDDLLHRTKDTVDKRDYI